MAPASPLSILLVEDDDFDGRNVQRGFAQTSGDSVTITWKRTFEEGMAAASEDRFDLLNLDMGLPDHSGKETLLHARMMVPHVPIVVMTGASDPTLALWALEHGAQEYLIKGEISPRAVERAVRHAIERSRMLARIEAYATEARSSQTRVQQGLLAVVQRLPAIEEAAQPEVRKQLVQIRRALESLLKPSDPFFD